MSSKIIAVTGATGSQGGGVVNVLSKTPGWKVRAITRNATSESAKKLAAKGIEVVEASFDDEASLIKAFEGVHAIFAVTNWWEHLFTGKTQDEAGVLEVEQGTRIASAASKISTLEHYFWSTCPDADGISEGKLLVPHMDYKAKVDAHIKAKLPELASKTTYLLFGYYPQNIIFLPMCQPILVPGTGKYVQILPTKPDAVILNSGDMSVNPGIWVRQALAKGPISFGKYANVALERFTFREMLNIWGEVLGRETIYLEANVDDYTKLWGTAGKEFAMQLKFGEHFDPWTVKEDTISVEELGIDTNEVVGFKGAIEKLKAFIS